MQYFCLKLVQNNEYLVSTVDTDDLVLQHQGISSISADNTPTHPVSAGSTAQRIIMYVKESDLS